MLLRRALSLLVVLVWPSLLAADPSIEIEEGALAVSGITPKGEVVWFGVARETSEYSATVVRRDLVLADEDGDGKVRLELGRPVPVFSVWIAVDLATGAWAAAAPEGSTAAEVPATHRPRGRGEPGRPDWVEIQRDYVEVAVIRPGEGAWGLTLGDGGQDDGDGAPDGRLTASLARMRGLGHSPAAPERFSPRDVVAVIDPNRMEFYVETLAAPKP